MSIPGMSGIECLQQVKLISRASAIPVYMYSTAPPHSYEKLAKTLGAERCIQKSPDFFETCEQIASFIQDERQMA